MKNLLKFILLILLFYNAVSADELSANVSKSYNYGSDFNVESREYTKIKDKSKSNYKLYKKLDKLYEKNKYSEILKLNSDFLPALYNLAVENEAKENYETAISYLKKIRTKYPDFEENLINEKIVEDLYVEENFKEIISLAQSFEIKTEKINYFISAAYFNTGNYNKAIAAAEKVKFNKNFTIPAIEIIFKSYYRQKDKVNAYKYAKILVSKDGTNPQQYLRLSFVTPDKTEELSSLYKARNLTNNLNYKFQINSKIIKTEQSKIDNKIKNSSKFIEQPVWTEIISPFTKYGSNTYWINRQDLFFSSTNNCIRHYSGSELSSCFTSVVNKQNLLNQQLVQEKRIEQENNYRQAILEQNERMIFWQQMQTINQIIMNQNLNNIDNSIRNQKRDININLYQY
ncbi:tetratricopeptide repeat protein [bacterium]|nr:tetratricopeptide repeat protein [bacterium]